MGGSSGVVGVSGGERRRVSIALELCARPRVLLMDEVTSGLDSHTAHKLVTMLKRIARDHNRIMITAIHQPSQAIFNKMDRLLLLAGGRAVFSGPSDEVDGMLTNARVPRTAEMPMADFLLDLVNEPVQMKAVQQYSARTVDGRGLDLGQDAGNWVHQKLKSRKAPLLYRLGILVRSSLQTHTQCLNFDCTQRSWDQRKDRYRVVFVCRCGGLCWMFLATGVCSS